MEEKIETVEVVEVPQELTLILNQSGLELSESEVIKQSYLPYFIQLAEIKEQAKKINFDNPTDIDEKIARELRLKTVKVRTGCESVKDERKRIHTLKANVEQSTWNLIKSGCLLEEEIFYNVEKARAIAEQKRKDNLKAERIEQLRPFTEQPEIYPLGEMSEDAYNDLLNGLKLAAQAKIEAAEKAEADRIAKAAQEAAEREAQRLENIRLKAEAEAKEKAEKLEAEKAAKAPKKQRLTVWVSDLSITPPTGMEQEAVVVDVINKFNAFKVWATEQITKI
jgi:hypothetical protein